MPTYEYACSTCGARPEVQQKMTDDSLTVCPACGATGLRKLFTNVGVVFKGSGFYRNDSRDSNKQASESSTPAKSTTADAASSGSSSSNGDSTSTSAPSPAPAAPASAPASTPAPAKAPASS